MFSPGQEVTLVDARNGWPVEIVRVATVDFAEGQIGIDGYTHRFDLCGNGLPEETGHFETRGAVYDLTGTRVPGSGREVWVCTERLPPRNSIHPVRSSDRKVLREAEERCDLLYLMEQRLAAPDLASVPLPDIRRAAALLGVSRGDLPMAGWDGGGDDAGDTRILV